MSFSTPAYRPDQEGRFQIEMKCILTQNQTTCGATISLLPSPRFCGPICPDFVTKEFSPSLAPIMEVINISFLCKLQGRQPISLQNSRSNQMMGQIALISKLVLIAAAANLSEQNAGCSCRGEAFSAQRTTRRVQLLISELGGLESCFHLD